MSAEIKTATARLAKFGKVVRCEVRRAGSWWVVDATVALAGRVTCCHATAPTLDAALAHLGC